MLVDVSFPAEFYRDLLYRELKVAAPTLLAHST